MEAKTPVTEEVRHAAPRCAVLCCAALQNLLCCACIAAPGPRCAVRAAMVNSHSAARCAVRMLLSLLLLTTLYCHMLLCSHARRRLLPG